jgi:quinol monooxygenase YgiN
MRFVQVVEFRTSRIEELEAYLDAWIARTQGQRVPHRAQLGRDRDQEGCFQLVVEFASYEVGMENSRRPQTAEFAEFLASVCDGPPAFRNIDILRDESL